MRASFRQRWNVEVDYPLQLQQLSILVSVSDALCRSLNSFVAGVTLPQYKSVKPPAAPPALRVFGRRLLLTKLKRTAIPKPVVSLLSGATGALLHQKLFAVVMRTHRYAIACENSILSRTAIFNFSEPIFMSMWTTGYHLKSVSTVSHHNQPFLNVTLKIIIRHHQLPIWTACGKRKLCQCRSTNPEIANAPCNSVSAPLIV